MTDRDPLDEALDAVGTYLSVPLPENREAARAALKRWVKREVRDHALSGEAS